MLTAVEEFALRHDLGELPVALRTYRSHVPAAPPGPGQQYAFDVDLDACTGCKACVVGCHNLNGLDADESWRSVGLLRPVGGDGAARHVTTACHHCVEPACLAGCPVDAYDKDPLTGIVHHLDDQCIGCGYCTWTCPYEVPQFNPQLGIVRKCDLCRGRLAAGEAPACVQACPNGAIAITVVDVAAVVDRAAPVALVPGAPPSSLTRPATTYRSARPLEGLVAADAGALRPRHAHPPLAVMLVLTQVAVGTVAASAAARLAAPRLVAGAVGGVGAVMGAVALAVSIGHLGRPRYAYRALLGVGHSWLSREVAALGGFGLLAIASSVAAMVGRAGVAAVLAAAASAAGAAGVGCSVAVYAVCGRRWWSLPRTGLRFVATSVAGGGAVLATVSASSALPVRPWLLAAVAGAAAGEAAADVSVLVPLRRHPDLARTARLLLGPLRGRLLLRAASTLVAVVLLAAATALSGSPAVAVAAAGTVALVAGQLAGRELFFTAEAGARMPGPPA